MMGDGPQIIKFQKCLTSVVSDILSVHYQDFILMISKVRFAPIRILSATHLCEYSYCTSYVVIRRMARAFCKHRLAETSTQSLVVLQ
jgi:hypothetical protein